MLCTQMLCWLFQQCKPLHLFALLLLLQLAYCFSAIELFPHHEPETIYSKFDPREGNLPVKLFNHESDLQATTVWPIEQSAPRLDSLEIDKNRLTKEEESLSSEEMDESLFNSNEQTQLLSSEMVLPRRERRLNWNRWLQWFKPLDRTSVGFMPVRGRKTTFIAARGKKSIGTAVKADLQNKKARLEQAEASKNKVYYFLMALTVKPIQADAIMLE